jgi:hypothetical protein
LYFGRFAVVHIGGPSSNQAASLESQPIHSIQLLFGRTLRLLIDGAPQLPAPFTDFVMLGENAIHGSDRAQIDALVEQAGVDFGWSQIDKPRLPQQVEDDLALVRDKRPHRRWPWAHGRKRLSPEGLAAMKAPRDSPSAVQAAVIKPLPDAKAATASIKTLRRSPLGGPTTPQLFFEVL